MAEQKGNEKVISDLIDPLIEKARENPGGKEALMMIAFMCDILKRLVGIVFENSNYWYVLNSHIEILALLNQSHNLMPRNRELMKILAQDSAVCIYNDSLGEPLANFYETQLTDLRKLTTIAVGWLTRTICALNPKLINLWPQKEAEDLILGADIKRFIFSEIPKILADFDRLHKGKGTIESYQGLIIDIAKTHFG